MCPYALVVAGAKQSLMKNTCKKSMRFYFLLEIFVEKLKLVTLFKKHLGSYPC
jgi:hypothetical protein